MTIYMGEAVGFLQVLQWIWSLDIFHIIFKMDCKVVVDRINKGTQDTSETGSINQECRRILESFPNFSLEFIRRQANIVAHTLATVATSYVAS